MPRVYTVILGGGRGQRLFPLTMHRAKPAVPVAGKYRLIDITLSNAINSGYRHIAVLTQFNSASLNAHIANTYRFDIFGQGQVEVLAAEQTAEGSDWYNGTADAVRKQLRRLTAAGVEHLLILSGDHLYRMDYREIMQRHLDSNADATVSVLPVDRSELAGFGVLSADEEGRITAFREKPKPNDDLSALLPSPKLRADWKLGEDQYLASMGVYVFKFDVLRELLANPDNNDFGQDILPGMLQTHRLHAHPFNDYWRDIGTISSFYEANLALCGDDPPFRLHHSTGPVYTRQRFLPATKFRDCRISQSIVSEGCLIWGSSIDRSIVGIRSRVQAGASLKDVIMMGADYYENDDVRASNLQRGIQAVGVGPGTVVERAILDKNARIGANCVIRGAAGRPDEDGDGWYLRDGIVIVPKDAQIPEGTVV
jgi:glucose-1-phosphate adenylyltransferase